MVVWRNCGICGVASTFHDRGIFCYSSRDFCGDLYRHLGRSRRDREGQMSKESEWDKVDKATSVLLSNIHQLDTKEQVKAAVAGLVEKRLTYKELIS